MMRCPHCGEPIQKATNGIQETWRPPENVLAEYQTRYPELDVERELEKFRDHFIATGKTYKNWTAAYRNWLRRAAEYAAQRPIGHQNSNGSIQTRNPFVAVAIKANSGT